MEFTIQNFVAELLKFPEVKTRLENLISPRENHDLEENEGVLENKKDLNGDNDEGLFYGKLEDTIGVCERGEIPVEVWKNLNIVEDAKIRVRILYYDLNLSFFRRNGMLPIKKSFVGW